MNPKIPFKMLWTNLNSEKILKIEQNKNGRASSEMGDDMQTELSKLKYFCNSL